MKGTPFIKKRAARGFTLVEIMVAMVISLVILGGAISVLVQNQRNYRENDDFGRLQENARFALDMIAGDLRMAGFLGCVRNNRPAEPVEMTRIRSKLQGILPGGLLDVSFYLDGWDDQAPGTWSAIDIGDPDPESIDGLILQGTDAITIRRLRNRGVPITQNMATADDNIVVTAVPVNVGEIAAIYNCEGTDIFQAINGTTADTIVHQAGTVGPGNASDDLSRVYRQNPSYLTDPDALGNKAKTFVAAFDAVRYYISNETARPSLWRQYHNGAMIDKQELVEGIENMQILYGVDGTAGAVDGVPDDFRRADQVANWTQVIAVKVNLLVSTVDEYGAEIDDRFYDINGTPNNPADDVQAQPAPDRRTRKLVSSTVLLRNMQTRITSEG